MATILRNGSDDTLCGDPTDATSLLEAQKHHTSPTPLPKAQLAALCTIRLVDPIAFTQVFPYINEFIIRLNVTDDPSQIGFYSGLVV
ncbi:hypothetical protein H0H87_012216 [Tephrocybe sp. NHM501043]|nr:hypothetical protein H0H87_012216 [Tephrocybe sp. NHM501043]